MNFSIDAIEKSASEPFDVLVGKYEDGTPVGFKVVGPGSEQYAAADREIQILNIKEAALRRAKLDLTTDADAAVIADGAERRRVCTVEHCVVGLFGFTDEQGRPLECNVNNVRRLLKARPHWVTQILSAIEDERNFTKA